MDNIDPKIWGGNAWKFLHCIVRAYPNNPTEEDKTTYANFFKMISDVLPCAKCRVNFKKELLKLPMDSVALQNKTELLKWWVNIRNEANKNVDKPPKSLEGYDSDVFTPVVSGKEPSSGGDKQSSKLGTFFILLLIVVAAVGAYKMYKYNKDNREYAL